MRLLQKQNIEDILFFDIETAYADPKFSKKSPLWDAWHYDYFGKGEGKDITTQKGLIELYFSRSPLRAEYGRIACITIGAVRDGKVILKTFSDENEKKLLENFNESLAKFATNKTWLSGHNILDFDIPFIMKRCLVNRVPLHMLFDTAHLKPWETSVLDTAILWKGTGWKKQSLLSVLSCLGIPSPKDDISGADVGRLYYEGQIDRIVAYCEKDVLRTIDLMFALRYEDPIGDYVVAENVEPIPKKILDYLYEGGAYDDATETQLQDILSDLSDKDFEIAVEILNTIPTKAKGKETFITKKDIKKFV